MGSLLSTIRQKSSSPTAENTTAYPMASSTPETFKHYANAQAEFTKTLPLIGNENAFLRDIFTSGRTENPISSGFYRLEPGTPLIYTYTYDEMKIIVDGDFEISDQSGQSVKATKGDVFFFPKGSVITFKTEKGGLGFFCGQRGKDTA